jgi:hypothetical protein
LAFTTKDGSEIRELLAQRQNVRDVYGPLQAFGKNRRRTC